MSGFKLKPKRSGLINAHAGMWRRLFIPCICLSCFTLLAAQNTTWKYELRLAIRSNDVAKVATIFSSNSLPPDVALDENSVTPLHLASLMGSCEVASWLLGRGAPVDAATTEQGHTPLIVAAGLGHVEVAKLLLEHSAKIDRKDSAGLTPLLWAIHQNQTAMAEYFIRQGADINATANIGRSALMMAAAETGSAPLVTELIAKGANGRWPGAPDLVKDFEQKLKEYSEDETA